MGRPIKVLIVAPTPDDRPSTRVLRGIVDELRTPDRHRTPPVDVSVWFLRDGPRRSSWPDARVIDDLRTWGPAVAVDRVSSHLGHRWRGLVQRWWRLNARPDVVWFDDGAGRHLFGARVPRVTVVRHTADRPPAHEHDPSPMTSADLVIGRRPTAGAIHVRGTELIMDTDDPGDGARHDVVSSASARDQARRVLRLPSDRLVIGGWAPSDRPEVFDRFLEVIAGSAEPGEPPAHAIWFDADADPRSAAATSQAAAAAGVEGRVHVRTVLSTATLAAVDVIVLPDRSAGPPAAVRLALLAGLRVITGTDANLDDDAVVEIAPDDSAAIAHQVRLATVADRALAVADARRRLTLTTWVDEFVAPLAEQCGPRTVARATRGRTRRSVHSPR